MPSIHSVSCALPAHYYDQETLVQHLLGHWRHRGVKTRILEAFHRNVMVGGRHLALPLEAYGDLRGMQARNDAWLAISLELAERAITNLLARTDFNAGEISLLASATVTGIAVPSLEARLMNRLPFATTTKRLPIFGLGCLAGAAGIHRVADYLMGHPREAAIFLSVELCSLTMQIDDCSVPNMIASGLFGDGCAAVILLGDEHPLADRAPLTLCTWESTFFPHTEHAMGWDVVDSGFKVVLGASVPALVECELPTAVQSICRAAGIAPAELEYVIAHPGGPKVLEAMEKVFAVAGLAPNVLKPSWENLARYGNMSSVSVLFELARTLADLPPRGARGLLIAMGPAFCAELGVLQCQ